MKKQTIYFDNAATTSTPEPVLDAMQSYYTDYRANIHRGFYDEAIKADKAYEASKASVAGFINASPEEIVYTPGTTASINMLARMFESEITSEHNIVLTEMEHHANLIPWQQLAKRTGAELRFIPITGDYRLDYAAASKLIDAQTKVLSFVHVSNVLGTINDAKALVDMATAVNAYSIIDAAQSIAHMPIDVMALGCDFLVASGHKMYGPTGIGLLYIKQTHIDALDPSIYGGGMIKSVSFKEATWATGTAKFEAGTPPIAEAIGLGAACEYILNNKELIIAEQEITYYLLAELINLGATIIGPGTEQRIGVVSFTLGDAHPHDIADILGREGIAVRAGHHCAMPLMKQLRLPGTTRASTSMHTSKEDIDALIVGLKKVIEVLNIKL